MRALLLVIFVSCAAILCALRLRESMIYFYSDTQPALGAWQWSVLVFEIVIFAIAGVLAFKDVFSGLE
jgi:hypothetical protein